MSKRNTQAQVTPEANGEAMVKLLTDIAARLTALEAARVEIVPTPTDEAKPARKGRKARLTKAEKAAIAERNATRDANAARLERNVAAGRMPTARFACDGCKHASYKAEVAQAHASKTGHVVHDA
jgi:hypothetical protein